MKKASSVKPKEVRFSSGGNSKQRRIAIRKMEADGYSVRNGEDIRGVVFPGCFIGTLEYVRW